MSSIFGEGIQRPSDPFGSLRSFDPRGKTEQKPDQKQADRLVAASRRFRRPPELLNLVRQLDLYTDPQGLQAAIDWIKQQYTVHDIDFLAGLFSRCYLGAPYVDHRMTIVGSIIEHYAPGDVVPDPYAAARALAANPSYDYIEIYADGRLIPIYSDGTAGDPTEMD